LLSYEKQYFRNHQYSSRECVIKRYLLDVLRWASQDSGVDFLYGKERTALTVDYVYGPEREVLASRAWVFGFSLLLQHNEFDNKKGRKLKKSSSSLGTKRQMESLKRWSL